VRRIKILILMSPLLVVYMLVHGFPQNTGEHLAYYLVRFDFAEAQESLCPDTSLEQVITLLSDPQSPFGTWLGSALQQRSAPDAWSTGVRYIKLNHSYDFTRAQYTFSYTMNSTYDIAGVRLNKGVMTAPVIMNVRRLSLNTFCLTLAA
jgi:hypothetical protein